MEGQICDENRYSVIGKYLPRQDAYEKVTGEAHYLDDIKLPDLLIGKVLRSPHPHARILTVDTSKAPEVLGFVSVITAEDTPEERLASQLSEHCETNCHEKTRKFALSGMRLPQSLL